MAPDAFHVPDWLTVDEQFKLIEEWRKWAQDPLPMQHVQLPMGKQMSVQMVCLGWQWVPYKYVRGVNGIEVAPMPGWLAQLGKRAVIDVYGDSQDYEPDAALINFYDADAKMGMHQDKDEQCNAPVVSFSIGDSCVFRFGNAETRKKPYTDIELLTGDLFVFGGRSRFAYHGVTKIRPNTGDPTTGLQAGRINVTMRMTGLSV